MIGGRLLLKLLGILLAGGLSSFAVGQFPRPTPGILAALVPASPASPRDRLPDPFPITRVLRETPGSPIPLAEQAAWKLLTRAEFESLVQAASRTLNQKPPLLIEAIYSAAWSPEGLSGTGRWKFLGSGWAKIEASLAFREIALLHGELKPGGVATWLRVPDTNAPISFQWSASSQAEGLVQRFNLKWPPAPVVRLELDLPERLQLSVAEPARIVRTESLPGMTRWHILAGQQSTCELTLHSAASDTNSVLGLSCARVTRWTIQPDQTAFEIELNLNSTREGQSFMVGSPQPLDWTSLQLPNGWSWSRVGSTNQLKIETVAGAGGVVKVEGRWAGDLSQRVHLPEISLSGVNVADDAVQVRLDPELSLALQEPGDFRLNSVQVDRETRLNYVGTLLPEGVVRTSRRMPRVHVTIRQPVWETTEELRWQPLPEPGELSAVWQGPVTRGPLSQVRLQIPLGYQPISVTTTPTDPHLSWSVTGAELLIDLSRVVSSGEQLQLKVDFRPTQRMTLELPSSAGRGRRFPFPQVTRLGQGARSGTLEVLLPADYRAWSNPAPSRVTPTSLVFTTSGQALAGEIVLTRNPSSDLTIDLQTTPLASQKQVQMQLRLSGPLAEECSFFAPLRPGLRWTREASAGEIQTRLAEGFTALSLFGVAQPWAILGLVNFSHQTPGELWQLQNPRPDSAAVNVQCTAVMPSEERLLVPVPLANRPVSTQVKLLDGSTSTSLAPFGVVPADPSRDGTDAPVRLVWDRPALELLVGPTGTVQAKLSVPLLSANGESLRLKLPAAAQLGAVRIGGLPSLPAPMPSPDAELLIPLPVIRPSSGTVLEVEYSLPRPVPEGKGWPILKYDAVLPDLFSPEKPLAVSWQLAEEQLIWPSLERASSTNAIRVLARREVRLVFGVVAAALLAYTVGIMLLGHPSRWQVLFLAACVLAATLALGLAPSGWQPYLRPLTAALWLCAVLLAGSIRLPRQTMSGVVLAMLLLGQAGVAQAPESHTVYLWQNGQLLAPTDLLTKLTQAAREPQPQVALQDAELQADLSSQFLQVLARWTLMNQAGPDKIWTLPLTGVRLQELLINEQPADVLATTDAGYQLRLPPAGTLRIQARFAIPTAGRAGVQFGMPNAPTLLVRLKAAAELQDVQVTSRLGRQVPVAAAAMSEWLIDHGSGTQFVLSWKPPTNNAPPVVTARQLAVWDLAESHLQATFGIRYDITSGRLRQLALQWPESLALDQIQLRTPAGEPVLFQARRPDPKNAALVELKLQRESDASLILLITARSKSLATLQPTLQSLSLSGVTSGEADLVIRLNGVVLGELPRIPGVIDYSPDSVLRLPGLGNLPEFNFEARPPDRVLHQTGLGEIVGKPRLQVPARRLSQSLETRWTIGKYLSATVQLRGSAPVAVPATEFELSGDLTIQHLRGVGVAKWSQVGERVQVWFIKPLREWTIEASTPRVVNSGGSRLFRAARSAVREDSQRLVLLPEPGWHVNVEPSAGWQLLPNEAALTFLGHSTSAPLTGMMTGPPGITDCRLVEELIPESDGLRYQAEMSCQFNSVVKGNAVLEALGLTADFPPEISVDRGIVELTSEPSRWILGPLPGGVTTWTIRFTTRLTKATSPPELLLYVGETPVTWSTRTLAIRSAKIVPSSGPEGWQRLAAWDGQQSQWQTVSTLGRWRLVELTSPQDSKPNPASASGPAPRANSTEESEAQAEAVPDLVVLAWSLGVVGWLALVLACRPSWRPERFTFAGLLGLWMLGPTTPFGWVFVLMIGFGLFIRLKVVVTQRG